MKKFNPVSGREERTQALNTLPKYCRVIFHLGDFKRAQFDPQNELLAAVEGPGVVHILVGSCEKVC